jgi:hypothetical protein
LMNGGKPAEEVAIFTHIESCPPSDVQMVSFGRERLPMVNFVMDSSSSLF